MVQLQAKTMVDYVTSTVTYRLRQHMWQSKEGCGDWDLHTVTKDGKEQQLWQFLKVKLL